MSKKRENRKRLTIGDLKRMTPEQRRAIMALQRDDNSNKTEIKKPKQNNNEQTGG